MNQNKLNLTQALVVEGKYDAARLANLVDATILTTDGFAIFKDKTMQALFKRIAAAQGMILLTDSDAAGFKIRHYITGLVGPQNVLQAYIPAVPGAWRGRCGRCPDSAGAAYRLGRGPPAGPAAEHGPHYLYRSV